MALVGMDTDLATSQHTQLSTQGEQAIQQIIQTLDSLLGQIADNWRGNDSTNFHNDWQSTHRTQLSNIATSLGDFATTFNNNIQQQIQTSAS